MTNEELLTLYNYDAFVPEKFEPWMRFHETPQVGEGGPRFPLWDLAGTETSLDAQWKAHRYLVVEFGSFT